MSSGLCYLWLFFICHIGEGATFGEIALINPDCIRTASVVAEDKTDLVAIHRELYNRSVSKVVAKEYAEKMDFIESLPIFEVTKVIIGASNIFFHSKNKYI